MARCEPPGPSTLQELMPLCDGAAGFQAAISRSYFPYEITASHPLDRLNGACATALLGAVRLSRMHSDGAFCGHRARIRHNDRPAYLLCLVEEGGTITLDGHRSSTVHPGDIYLINSQHPLRSRQHGAGTSLSIALPPPLLRSRFVDIDDWCLRAMPTSEGAGALLRDAMEAIWRQRRCLDQRTAQGVMDALVHLIGAAFGSMVALPPLPSRTLALHYMRLRDAVTAHLDESGLSAAFLADRLGISKSYIFSIMHAAGTTLGQFILESRLERSRAMLADDAAARLSISEIAFCAGFQDLSHFSRRFAARYGQSPRAFRATLHAASAISSQDQL